MNSKVKQRHCAHGTCQEKKIAPPEQHCIHISSVEKRAAEDKSRTFNRKRQNRRALWIFNGVA
jgi:hypothetical protein